MHIPKQLYILPFDHRSGFAEKILGYDLDNMSDIEREHVSSLKHMVYEAVQRVIERGVSKEKIGILVDEQFGTDILMDAKKKSITRAVCVEKSGKKAFEFEYGSNWQKHIADVWPDIVKALIRWDPTEVPERERQLRDLRTLSDFCTAEGFVFLLEPLIPPAAAHADVANFDTDFRPDLTVQMIHELQDAGIEPHIWKLEGIGNVDSMQKVSDATVRDGREAKIVVLGRNEGIERIKRWLDTGKSVPNTIGFAVGRTIFSKPLLEFNDNVISHDVAVNAIADGFEDLIRYWEK